MNDRRPPINVPTPRCAGAKRLTAAAVLAVSGMATPAVFAQSGVDGGDGFFDVLRELTPEAPASPPVAESMPASPDTENAGAGEGEGVSVSEYMTVDIFVQDEDLANVLQMLSLQSQRNIVASRDVSATVTANLYGVTFYEALDSILHVNGYGYIEKGNFIYVYPAEVIEQMQQQQRQIVSKVISLNYLNANDAAEFVSPLLSEVGQIKTNGDVGAFSVPDDTPTGAEEFALSATLVVYDYEEHVEEVEALLDQLDTRPSQVLVEATILQTTLEESNAFGVDFSLVLDVEFSDFIDLGGPFGATSGLSQTGESGFQPADDRGGAITGTPGNFPGPATLKAGFIYDDVAVFMRVLDEVSDVMVLSNPKILALNRQPARVLVGRKVGYLNTTTTDTSTTQSVEFLDTGTQLAFRPFVAKDGMIRMELKPRVSEGFPQQATNSDGVVVTIPDEVTQEITTNVLVPDGATIVLGGLFREQTTMGRRQVPVLGDIPLLGAAFRGHDDETQRTEIIFMVKPTIMKDAIMIDQGDRAVAYAERVRTGTRQGLLPFSRERQTAQLNVQAERFAREGEMNKAMWALRRSLELNPMQPDAVELRQRLFGVENIWPDRSILERIVEGGDQHAQLSGWPQIWKPGEIHTATPGRVASYETRIADQRRRDLAAADIIGPEPIDPPITTDFGTSAASADATRPGQDLGVTTEKPEPLLFPNFGNERPIAGTDPISLGEPAWYSLDDARAVEGDDPPDAGGFSPVVTSLSDVETGGDDLSSGQASITETGENAFGSEDFGPDPTDAAPGAIEPAGASAATPAIAEEAEPYADLPPEEAARARRLEALAVPGYVNDGLSDWMLSVFHLLGKETGSPSAFDPPIDESISAENASESQDELFEAIANADTEFTETGDEQSTEPQDDDGSAAAIAEVEDDEPAPE